MAETPQLRRIVFINHHCRKRSALKRSFQRYARNATHATHATQGFYARYATYARGGQWRGWNLSRGIARVKL